ncbi:dihydroorotase [Verrucomicrobia bacterium]|nr:dihydroorotase [Verrucomicrobiota bacterium]
MESLLIQNGRVIDPANGIDAHQSLLILNGKIAALGAEAEAKAGDEIKVIDARGKVVCPGLVDIHVHLREPGQSAKETIETGTKAAALGGFTTVVCMPNTTPSIDSPGTVALIQDEVEKSAAINVFTTGAITKGIQGDELAPIGSLHGAGVVAITDDGRCVQSNELMRRACEYAKMFDLPLMDHCQDYDLVGNGVMNEGHWSNVLGLPGWPAAGEEIIVARNIQMAELTGTHIHCQHMSSAGAVNLIREARDKGIPISGEACPHHFTLTDAALAGSAPFWEKEGKHLLDVIKMDFERPEWESYDTLFKMNPPLRSGSDRDAVLQGVADGTLSILGSDHAPHCGFEKEVEFDSAPFGITGLESELALGVMRLYHTDMMSLSELIRRWTEAPAKLVKLDKGTLSVGADGDVTIFDPEEEWIYDRMDTPSKANNSPFHGWPLKGRNKATILMGKVVFEA